jgi:hypothetical protein
LFAKASFPSELRANLPSLETMSLTARCADHTGELRVTGPDHPSGVALDYRVAQCASGDLLDALGRGDDLRIEGIPNGRQIRFKADFWRVSFGRRSTSG